MKTPCLMQPLFMPTSTVPEPLKKEAQAIGHSKGGVSTKIHAQCGALVNPTGFHLMEGQAHELEGADVFLEDFATEALLVDKAFDADEHVLQKQGVKAIIPSKGNRKEPRHYDRELYNVWH